MNETRSNNLLITADEIGFKAEELRECAACGRTNPPTRLDCMYCAAELHLDPADRQSVKINTRRLENWEKGYNILVLAAPAHVDCKSMAEVCRQTSISSHLLEALMSECVPAPVSRVEKMTEADVVLSALAELGFAAVAVSDAELAAEIPPARCRSISFGDYSLTLTPFNDGPDVLVESENVALLVTGSVYESKIATTEKRKRGQSSVLSESQTFSDTPLLDLYTTIDTKGFRIPASGFDFSVLGPEKELIASKNLELLIAKLRSFAPDAKFVGDYKASHPLLDEVWEPEQRKDSLGMQRTGFGRKNLAAVATSSNLAQFTKYSRMQRHLL